MKNIIFLLLLLFTIKVFGQHIAPVKDEQIVKHKFYTVSYNHDHKQANWTYYLLTKKMAENETLERKDNFKVDPDVEGGSAKPSEYDKSGYDQGHLVNAKDMEFDQTALNECFYTSNMSPQKPGFNRGIWKHLENQVRKMTLVYDTLYVISAGSILKLKSYDTIGKGITVPKEFYKIIYTVRNGKINKVFAYLLPNEATDKELSEFIVAVDKIEQETGLNFFNDLSKEEQNKIESVVLYYDGN